MSGEREEVELEWWPHYDGGELKVGLVREGHTDVFASHATLTAEQLRQQSRDATTLDMAGRPRGRYMALVGSMGCPSCVRYTKSESFSWPPPVAQKLPDGQSPDEEPPKGAGTSGLGYLHVYIIVGIFVFLFLFAVGILVINKLICRLMMASRRKSLPRDTTVETPLNQHSLLTASTFHVLYWAREEVRETALDLRDTLQQAGLRATIEELSQETMTSEADVIMHVCVKESDEPPRQLKSVAQKTVTVDVRTPLPTVSFPANFCYSDVPNTLHYLHELFNLLGARVQVLVLSCGEDSLQVKACRQLVTLLDQPPLRVVYIAQDDQLSKLREDKSQWIHQLVREASFILVIASPDLVLRHNCYILTEITNCILDRVEQSERDLEKVVLVSLGDCPNQTTIAQRPMFSNCPKFDLVVDFFMDTAHVELLPLVSYLCKRRPDILQETCGQTDEERICSQQHDNFQQAVQNLNLQARGDV